MAAHSKATARRRQKSALRGKPELKKNADLDYKLIACIILLAGFGLIVLYSSSYYSEGTSMMTKQAVVTALGLFFMMVMAEIDYHILKPLAMSMFFASILITLLVRTPLGVEINGARRWIKVPGTTFQPAEFVKMALILAMAGILSTYWNRLTSKTAVLGLLLAMFVPAIEAFVVTENLSSAIILLVISYGMIFLSHPKDGLWILAAAAAIVLAAVLVYYVVKVKPYQPGESFRYTRLRIWFDPFNEAYPNSYQVRQGLYAISTGGLFGRGLGNSILKQGMLPEPYNDMIFAVLCEEMGLFGAAMVLYLFLYLIIRIFRIGFSAPDKFGFLICVGVMLHLASQVILNVLVVTNTIMNTGITLCFFSGGGSSLIFIYLEMGLVLSVARRIQNPK